MKKQFQILAATFISVAIVSCNKQGVENPEATQKISEEISTSSTSSATRTVVDPLTVNLEGWFPFNKNLKEATGKLPDAKQWPVMRGGVSYTADRHGISNAALKLDGNYYVYMANGPVQTHMSLSVWVKRSAQYADALFLHPNGKGLFLSQANYAFKGTVLTSLYSPYANSGAFIDQGWHHLVLTYDGNNLQLYADNVLQSSVNFSSALSYDLFYYLVGDIGDGTYWKGAIDDLRFYTRTLSASDVQKLYNL